MEMIIRVGFLSWKVSTTIGIKIPKVPHEVPVAKAKNTATRKMMAGRVLTILPDISFTSPAT